MGLTDAPKQVNLTDVYPEGSPFVIEKAWIEGVVQTQYGDRTMAKALIRPVGGGQPQEFALWGSLCEQVGQIEEGEVPGIYKVVKDGKRWLFAAAEADVAASNSEAALQGAAEAEVAPPAQAPPAQQQPPAAEQASPPPPAPQG